MSQLFGLVPAGQPVITTPTQAPTETSFLYAIPPTTQQHPDQTSLKPFSHIVVFLLPGVALPPGTAAAIYLVTPPTSPGQTEPNSKFLGGIGPGKESAIFKINSGAPTNNSGAAARGNSSNVVIGVSIEPADSVAQRIGELTAAKDITSGALAPLAPPPSPAPARTGTGTGQQPSTLVLAQRIIKNAFNFLASFSGPVGPNQVEAVPLKAFQDWWKKFEGRIKSDPGFLERDD